MTDDNASPADAEARYVNTALTGSKQTHCSAYHTAGRHTISAV